MEAHLEETLVSNKAIDHGKALRNHSAHPGEQLQNLSGAPRAIPEWWAILNAWILMHMGASTESVRAVLAAD